MLVFLHLFVAPCATAMVLMSADADCEHCQVVDGSSACIVASETSSSVVENLAFDAGRAKVPVPSALFRVADGPGFMRRAPASGFRAHAVATRHSGDPPLYLLFGQLRL